MPHLRDFICITAKVLPSMRKDRVYAVTIVIKSRIVQYPLHTVHGQLVCLVAVTMLLELYIV